MLSGNCVTVELSLFSTRRKSPLEVTPKATPKVTANVALANKDAKPKEGES